MLTDETLFGQVKREHLELQDKLGEGAFGKVFKGCLLEKPKFDTAIVVAVKELSSKSSKIDNFWRLQWTHSFIYKKPIIDAWDSS